jgi:methylthioribulose-1-phosphate dehydratase
LSRTHFVSIIQTCYNQGWSPATSGNYSFRDEEGQIHITPSGLHKGRLTEQDLLVMNVSGALLHIPFDDPLRYRPSAETKLHLQIYAACANARAVLHVHSPYATLASLLTQKKQIQISQLELQKIFPNIDTHDTTIDIPVVDNHQEMDALSATLQPHFEQSSFEQSSFQKTTSQQVPAYLIRGHGLYTWAENMDQAFYQIEAIEAMFRMTLQYQQLKTLGIQL